MSSKSTSSVITITMSLSMSAAQFDAVAQSGFLHSMAEALNVSIDTLAILSITQEGGARRLLTSSISVVTTATIPTNNVATVASFVTFDILQPILLANNLSIMSLDPPVINYNVFRILGSNEKRLISMFGNCLCNT